MGPGYPFIHQWALSWAVKRHAAVNICVHTGPAQRAALLPLTLGGSGSGAAGFYLLSVDPLFSLRSEPFCQALARDQVGPGQRNPRPCEAPRLEGERD